MHRHPGKHVPGSLLDRDLFAPSRGNHDDASAYLELVGAFGDGRSAGDRRRAWPAAAEDDDAAAAAKADEWLKAMTLDEKIGQMTQADLKAVKDKADVAKYALGSILSGGDSDPDDITAQGWAKTHDELQSWALKSRLKIPIIYGIDAVHGHNNVDGAVIFPHNIGLGATRDPALVEKAGRITALEVAGTGIRWAFAPCVAVARDERWGRTYESFGENPELAETLGAAAVRGLQGSSLADRHVGPRLRQALPRRRRHDRRHRPGQHRVRRGHAPEDPPAGLHRRHQGRRRLGHGLVQQLERQEDARPTSIC